MYNRQNKKEVSVSVIIPHYNSAKKLERLLKTVPESEKLQIIVVDDSSDKEVDIYCKVKEEYKDKAEFYENTPENKSAGGARNVGLQHARGQWLLFADADDFFVEGWWKTIEHQTESAADIIFFPPISVMEETYEPADRHKDYYDLAQRAYQELKNSKMSRRTELDMRYAWYSPCSKLIRRSVVEKHYIQFDVVKYANDMLFSTMVGFYAKKIDVIWETIYCITQGTGTLTSDANPDAPAIRRCIYKRHRKFLYYHLNYKDSKMLLDGPNGLIDVAYWVVKKFLYHCFSIDMDERKK